MNNKTIKFPPDHIPGIRVPVGGSSCKTCKYLKDPKNRICGNEYFIKWDGPNKPAGSDKIPGQINAYCSDWYEPAKGTITKFGG